MGYTTEFNWVLKLKPKQGLDEKILEEDKLFEFRKSDKRIYPIGLPIDLVNQDWEAVGKVIVEESTTTLNETYGKYKVLCLYDGELKNVLSNWYKENSKILKDRGAIS